MSSSPPLCIGLPIYNGATYLASALDSLLNQTYTGFRVVISDNASTDDTARICQEYARKDQRLHYTRVPQNIGAGPNFNRVFALNRSPFFKWMAHDDLLAPQALERMMAVLNADAGVSLVHTCLKLIDDAGHPLAVGPDGHVLNRFGRPFHRMEPTHLAEGPSPAQRFGQALRRMNWCTAIFGIIRADALSRTHLHGSYYEADRVLLAELALLGRFAQLDEPLMIKRCHAGVSVLKPYREQAKMIDPAVRPGPKGLRLRLGYLRTLAVTGELGLASRAACAIVVLRVSLRNRVIRAFLSWMRSRSERINPPTGGQRTTP